jgi:Zn-dependent peptidase ImmA (M78 family)
MRIKQVVESLCRKYGTRNPFELADYKNIQVLKLPLGSIKGYYNKCFRHKMIHINSDIPLPEQRFTCAHELGHSILHPDSNTLFLSVNTLFPIGRFEREANYFAIDLLISDDELKEYLDYSIPEIAACFHVSEELMQYRINELSI